MKLTHGFLAAMTGIALLASTSVSADQYTASTKSGVEIHPIGTLGFSQGGDTLGTYRVEFLGDTSDVDVDAGDSLFLYGGVQMRWPDAHLGMLIQGGLATTGVGSSSDGVDFKRWPVEAIGFVEAGKMRLGLGLTHHFSPTFDEDGTGGNLRVEFDNASGWIAQIEYHSGPATFGLRYVDISYDFSTLEIDGSSWGLFGTYIFGVQAR
ncbi:MAG: hypothetical protein QNI98_10040 [Woeseiaceae bacterium]|nr:hypothetical protein [Woeseiaceae bacterium]